MDGEGGRMVWNTASQGWGYNGGGKPLEGWAPDQAEDTPYSLLVPGGAFLSKEQEAARKVLR